MTNNFPRFPEGLVTETAERFFPNDTFGERVSVGDLRNPAYQGLLSVGRVLLDDSGDSQSFGAAEASKAAAEAVVSILGPTAIEAVGVSKKIHNLSRALQTKEGDSLERAVAAAMVLYSFEVNDAIPRGDIDVVSDTVANQHFVSYIPGDGMPGGSQFLIDPSRTFRGRPYSIVAIF